MGKFAENLPEHALGSVASLLQRNGINPDDMASSVRRISLYQNITKNEEGEAETHDLLSVQITPNTMAPMWEPVRQGPPVVIKGPRVSSEPPTGMHTAVILPDIQIGYFRSAQNDYEPVHDEAAMSVAMKITKQAKPQQVVLVGDNLDLPEFGKYRLSPRFRDTTQASIDRATTFGAELRSAVADECKLVWLAGNHEERLPNYILDNGSAAFGIRQGNTPDSFPVMSIPFLCRFDEFGIEYKPGYPAGSHWITERLRVIHGTKVASNGSTAHKYLGTEKTSIIYGHIHRREWAERTREDFDGPRTIMAASPGTLARTDGVVPSTKGGYDLDGRPVPVQEDWQQGLAVVTYDPDTGEFWYEQVPIRNGVAMWRGRFYSA